ncbi:MAG: hypothetical protein AB8B97_19515 [Granulosicoccus sp.]
MHSISSDGRANTDFGTLEKDKRPRVVLIADVDLKINEITNKICAIWIISILYF